MLNPTFLLLAGFALWDSCSPKFILEVKTKSKVKGSGKENGEKIETKKRQISRITLYDYVSSSLHPLQL
jgi:hypothetical protein